MEVLKRNLLDNISITLGLLLAILAISGMCIAIFVPALLSVNISPGYGIGALAVPLHHFDLQPETIVADEDDFEASEPLYVTVDIGDAKLDSPAPEVIPQNHLSAEVESLITDTEPPGDEEPAQCSAGCAMVGGGRRGGGEPLGGRM